MQVTFTFDSYFRQKTFYLNVAVRRQIVCDLCDCLTCHFTLNIVVTTPCPEKNGTTLFLLLTSTNTNRFSNFFHRQT